MSKPCWKLLAFLVVLCPIAAAAVADAPAVALPTTVNLVQLVHNSGYIFSGTVSVVEHIAPENSNEVATMRITFRVEQAIRGVRTGQTLVVREWAGLWEFGERYRVGERVWLFLHPPSRLGLTSAVGGQLGRFNIDRDGQIILSLERIGGLSPNSVVAPVRGPTRITTQEFTRAIRLAGRH